MGRLHWRERGTRLGCRRGWIRIAGLAAFALAGYLALYTWLRATGEIRVDCTKYPDDLHHVVSMSIPAPASWGPYFGEIYMVSDGGMAIDSRRWAAAVWLPVVRLEVALDRRGWSPWGEFVGRWRSNNFYGELDKRRWLYEKEPRVWGEP